MSSEPGHNHDDMEQWQLRPPYFVDPPRLTGVCRLCGEEITIVTGVDDEVTEAGGLSDA